MLTRRRAAAFLLLAALFCGPAAEAAYPDRLIRLVVPYPAGGGTDTLARLLAEEMASRLGQAIVVDNRPGANTSIGVRAVLSAPNDGYTVLLTSNQSFDTAPFVMKKLGYDPTGSLQQIRLVGSTPVALVVHPKLGVDTMAKFLELARRKPGEISYSSYGVQLNALLFQKRTGIELNAIAYKGFDGVQAFIGGQTDAMFDGLFTAMPNIRSGRIKALAVLQDKRSAFAPDVPSLADLGLQVPALDIWYVLAAAKGAPPEALDRLSDAVQAALQAPKVQKRLAELNVEILDQGPEAAQQQVEAQYRLYKDIAAQAGVSPE